MALHAAVGAVNLRMNPSMVVSIEGAFVLKEWEEEEVVEVPKKEEPAEGKACGGQRGGQRCDKVKAREHGAVGVGAWKLSVVEF